MNTLLVCIGLNGLLVFLLAFWTSIQRGQSNTIYHGTVLDPVSAMAKAQRAHGNCAEYAGVIVALLASCLALGAQGFVFVGTAIALTAARYLTAFGFLTCKSLDTPHWAKAVGALVTYLAGLVLTVYLIAYGAGAFGLAPG